MWPWDHLAIGYVAYSLLRRATGRQPPSAGAAGFVVLGSQFPDLVDKPLGWYVGVLPSGVSLAHSLLFAVPLCLAVGLWRARAGAPDQGVAFTVSYLLHLPADAIYRVLIGREANVGFLAWPIVPGQHSSPTDVSGYLVHLVSQFVEAAASPAGIWIVGLELGLVATAMVLWWRDGWPGAGVLRVGRSARDR